MYKYNKKQVVKVIQHKKQVMEMIKHKGTSSEMKIIRKRMKINQNKRN